MGRLLAAHWETEKNIEKGLDFLLLSIKKIKSEK
jgi:hypothetical protein